MTPHCRVTLTLQERDHLTALSKDTSTRAKRFLYARAQGKRIWRHPVKTCIR